MTVHGLLTLAAWLLALANEIGPATAQTAKLVLVGTAQELQKAVQAGAQHIRIEDHLDLSMVLTVPVPSTVGKPAQASFAVTKQTESITVGF
jgi:hypothetical protein